MAKVEKELLENRQAKLTVTVDPEQLRREMQDAARRISRHVNIPGFRKGKAPYRIVLQHFGEEAIFDEALDPLGQAVYVEALKEADVDPYAPGELSEVSSERDPLVLTFTVPLTPDVGLGEYRDVRIKYKAPKVTKNEVEEALDALREQQGTLDPVERPIAMGDVAVLDIVGTLVREGDEPEDPDQPSTWVNRQGVRVKVAEEATYPVPGFPSQVAGMAAGDERSFDISFSEEDEEVAEVLRGKTLHFEVRCDEVYEHKVPELNDDLAKELGEYETVKDLRISVRAELEHEAQHEADDEYTEKIFDKLLGGVATVSYPPVMLEEQIDKFLEDFDDRLRQQGLNLDEYKRINNTTDEQMRDEVRENAERQLKHALILGKLAEVEELHAKDEEIDDQISTMSLAYGSQATLARQLFGSPEARRSIANRLLAEKAVSRLIAIAKGEEPPIGDEQPAPGETVEGELDEAKKKPKARKSTAKANVESEEKPKAKKTTTKAKAKAADEVVAQAAADVNETDTAES